MTRIDPLKLEAVAILRKAGKPPRDIRAMLGISKATCKRRMAELRRVEQEARQLMRAADDQ